MDCTVSAHNCIVSSENVSVKSAVAANGDPHGAEPKPSVGADGYAVPLPPGVPLASIAHAHGNGTPAIDKLVQPFNAPKQPLGNGGEKTPLNAVKIPSVLKALAQWVNHAADKTPIDPKTGGAASTTNPATWSSFDTAWDRYATGKAAGVGFVLTENDPYTVVDLDHCRDPQTGEVFEWAQIAIDKLASYSEISPSGTGFHIFIRGKKPATSKCRREMGEGIGGKARTEAYGQWRYMTVTGRHVGGTPPTIEERQAALDVFCETHLGKADKSDDGAEFEKGVSGLDDAKVIAKATAAKNGSKFLTLWEGNWKGSYASPSNADMALVNILAFWVGHDEEQIDRLFRKSKLMRGKWDEDRGDTTYGQNTIARVLEDLVDWYGKVDEPHGKDEGGLANYFEPERPTVGGSGPRSAESTKRGLDPALIVEKVTKADGFPKQVRGILFARGEDGKPLLLTKPNELFAYLGRKFGDGKQSRVFWGNGESMLTKAEFYAALVHRVERFDAIEPYPHYPQLPTHYYMHQALQGGDGQALAQLLKYFCPATPVDASLIKALFLTGAWGGPGGSRPGFVISAEDLGDERKGCGVGKTALAGAFARLYGGSLALGQSEKVDAFKTRVLSERAQGLRVVLIDNLKSHHFSSGELEGMMTSPILSGKDLFKGEGQRPNTFTYLITTNGPALGKDLSERSVNIRLKRPDAYKPGWQAEVEAFFEANRWAILGDLLVELKREEVPLKTYTRWALWERAVLSKCDQPGECMKVLAERRGEMDDDQAQAAEIREAFVKDLGVHSRNPATCVVCYKSQDAWRVVVNATGDIKLTNNKTTRMLKTLPIAELYQDRLPTGLRVFVWRGEGSAAGQKPEHVFGE
jgi:hypothetical protein